MSKPTDAAHANAAAEETDPTKALFLAAFQGDVAACEAAVRRGGDANNQKCRMGIAAAARVLGGSPAAAAAAPGTTDVVNDRDGWTPLHWAAYEGHPAAVAALLRLGALPDTPDFLDGKTPLHWAVHLSHPGVIRALLGGGANVNALSAAGRTPLDLAWEGAVSALLEQHGARRGPGRRLGVVVGTVVEKTAAPLP